MTEKNSSVKDEGIFFDDWQACLRAHYEHVVRHADTVTEPTLRGVLKQTGLTDADLDAYREEALAMRDAEDHDAE